MRVVLVGPETEENLSIRYLSSALAAGGHEPVLAPFDSPEDEAAVEKACRRAGLVGLSMCFQTRARQALDLAGRLRRAYPRLPIVVGGHYASCAARELLERHPQIDIVGLAEGEETIVELADWYVGRRSNLDEIRGIAYRDCGGVRFSPPRRINEDLDSLPHPDRSGPVRLVAGVPTAAVVTSRGCPNQCDYCSIGTLHNLSPGKSFRQRDPQRIAQEMAELYQWRGIRQFVFHDDNFLVRSERDNMHRLGALDEALQARDVEEIGLFVTSRPGNLSRSVLEKLAAMGLVRLFLGIESSSAAGYASLGRRQTAREAEQALTLCREMGISTQYTMLVFHPEATVQTIRSDISFMERYADPSLNFVRAEAHAGTPLDARMTAAGRIRGDYLGHSYSLTDPVANLICLCWKSLFRERCGSFDGLLNRAIRLDHLASMLTHFYGGSACRTMTADIAASTIKIRRNSLDLFSRLVNVCVAHAARRGTGFTRAILELRRAELHSNKLLVAECAEREEAAERLALKLVGLSNRGGALRRTAGFKRSVARHVAAVSIAVQVAGIAPMVAASEMAEEPIDADNDGLVDALEAGLFGTDGEAADSNENGIPDDLEDHDGDGLTNAEEQEDILTLARAAWAGDVDEVLHQIGRGTDLNSWHPDAYSTALGSAANQGHIEVMQALLGVGADATAALVNAVQGETDRVAEVVRLLITSGADVNLDGASRSVLSSIAVDNGEVARTLLDAGADPEGSLEIVQSFPLDVASRHGHVAVATELIAAGADVNRTTFRARTPLIWAASHGHVEFVALLLSAGADVDATDDHGRTALIETVAIARSSLQAQPPGAYEDRLEIVRLLIESGADITIRDSYGFDALYRAEQYGHAEMLALLEVAADR